MKTRIILFIILVFSFNSLIGQSRLERKELKEEKSQKEYFEIKKFVESRMYKFEVDRVTPVRFPSIIFSGDGYYLTIHKDRVDTYLPYFGVRHSGGGFGESGGIEFNDSVEDYKVEYDDDKKRIIVKFTSGNKGERFDVTLSVFKNGSSSLSINSTSRSRISYSGHLVTKKPGTVSVFFSS